MATLDPKAEKTNTETLLDFVKEAVGVEKGLIKTFIDLRKKPKDVLASYLRGESDYVAPFKLLFGTLALWLFINSFIIDWYKIFGNAFQAYVDFLAAQTFKTPEQNARFIAAMQPFQRVFVLFVGDLFTKIYVPFTIIVVPLSSHFASKWIKDPTVNFKSILAVNSYSMGANIIMYLVMSVVAAINFFAFVGLSFVLVVLAFTGRNMMMLVPPRKFFETDNVAIEKKMLKANFYSVLIVMTIIGIGYFLVLSF